MTLDNIDAVEKDIIETTSATGGERTFTTGVRVTAPASSATGYGIIAPERCVQSIGTTITDPSVAVGSVVGAMSFVGLAYPASKGSPRELLRKLRRRG